MLCHSCKTCFAHAYYVCTYIQYYIYIHRLEKALEEKDLELAEAKDSYQTAMAQKNEGLRRRYVCMYVCTVYCDASTTCTHLCLCIYIRMYVNMLIATHSIH